MGEGTIGNIILIGFSYTGKSSVGREVARKLGWRLVDTDDEIVRLSGKPIADIFAQDGEKRFREMEKEALENVCREKDVVISTGGGIVMDPANREVMGNCGVVICLEAKPTTIHRRLLKDAEDNPEQEVRPLLAVADPLGRIEQLKGSRQPLYALADWTVHTDNLTIEEVAEEIIHGWEKGQKRGGEGGNVSQKVQQDAACVVTTATESYPVFVGWGFLEQLGERMRDAGLQGSAYVVSDSQVFPLYGDAVRSILEKAGFAVDSMVVPQGEQSKSFETAIHIYDWLVGNRAERRDSVIALGGGVVGDLAGFVAATFLRGIPLVQVPTSLIGMFDSAIGGKVAVDHPQGKNLIGAFYQPRLVIADIQTLTTLPQRELVSGWAEVIKHAMIRDVHLMELLEERAEGLHRLDREVTTRVVSRSAAIKAEVVSEDEKEGGLRAILNYGHTIGHGLEAATDYGRFLHGEAVAIGMMGAAMISQRVGLLSSEVVRRQRSLLEMFGLPTSCSDVDLGSVMGAMKLDKKVRGKKIRWVLLTDVGQTVIRDDVPGDVVENVIRELLQS
ncbi:MAG: 3-dehydroquinate synthase [Chloroflexota bacterium]|nr:3-dehydroquinate synthase [Chloroflexota bacterium]